MMASHARELLGCTRPAVAIVLLSANFAWAQGAQQPVQSIRLDVQEQDESSPTTTATEQSTKADAPVKVSEQQGTVRGVSARLSTGIGYDDNVFRTGSNTRDDFFWSLRPAVYLTGIFGRHAYRLGYEGNYAKYSDFSTNDFDDHRFFGGAHLDLSRKMDLVFGADYWLGHDPRGTPGNRLVVPGDLDRWEEYRVKTELIYGRAISRAQIIPWVELSGRRYTNNDQSIRDFDRQDLRLRGRWRFTPRFFGLAEGGYANIDHLDSRNTLDRSETELLIGFGWDATAKTSGEVLFGILNRDYKDTTEADSSNLAWDIRAYWTPKPYSKVTAFTRRSSEENAGGVSSFLADTFGALWRHGFSERLVLDTSIDYTIAEFDNAREDKYLAFDVGVTYELTRWLDFGATYRYLDRRSNIPGIDYDDNMFLLELRAGTEYRLGP